MGRTSRGMRLSLRFLKNNLLKSNSKCFALGKVVLVFMCVYLLLIKNDDGGDTNNSIREDLTAARKRIVLQGELHPAREHVTTKGLTEATQLDSIVNLTQLYADAFSKDNVSGYARAIYARDKCRGRVSLYHISPNNSDSDSYTYWRRIVRTIPQFSTLYCPVSKVGTTFWSRFMYQVNHAGRYKTPYEVPINLALAQKYIKADEKASVNDFKGLFKFTFVRNPYHRVLSAYIDKLLVPNPWFWNVYAKPAMIKFRPHDKRRGGQKNCYHDLTFVEFLKFVVWSERNQQLLDSHFQLCAELCAPCHMNFTFIGKMETFSEDTYSLYEKFNLKSELVTLKARMDGLTDSDAIDDTVKSPFQWKSTINRCMSWDEAMRRVWRKLQFRGLIGLDQNYPINKDNAVRLKTSNSFIQLVNEAKGRSNHDELTFQKKQVFVEMYRSVPLELLEELREVFKADFLLYNYDDRPSIIFDRSIEVPSHGILDHFVS